MSKEECLQNGKTIFQDNFAEEVWASTYKDHSDNNVNDTMYRVASAIASVEKTEELREHWAGEFYDMLTNFKATAGGRIYANAGSEFKGTTLINCYVSPRGNNDIDSLDNIMLNLKNQSLTLKSEGGWGENFSYIRPRGTFIHGIGVESPGAVRFMEIFDKSSEIVTAGSGKKSTNKKSKGKIRKGAMMAVLDCQHPDIMEFVTAKQTSGRLSKFNMSVNFTDDFMRRVKRIVEIDRMEEWSYVDFSLERKKLDKWDLIFPDTTHENYKTEWYGDIQAWQAKGYPVVVHDTISVMHLWNIVMESTYNRAEPGVLFLDRANYFLPLNYAEKVFATNPCVTGDTVILTNIGYKKIKYLVGKEIKVWNGYEWSTTIPEITGNNQEILDIIFSDGSELSCTPYHKFILSDNSRIEAKDLTTNHKLVKHNFPVIESTQSDIKLNSAYTHGFYAGDGSKNKSQIFLYGIKKELLSKLNYKTFSEHPTSNGDTRYCVNLVGDDYSKTFVPTVDYSIDNRLDWIAGLIDSDGNESDGCAQISSVDKEFLVEVRLLLNTLGCSSTLELNKLADLKMMPNGKGGKSEYKTQDLWRLNISANYIQQLVKLGLTTYRVKFTKIPNRSSARFIKIVSITMRNELEANVYCFNETKNHSGIFNGIITAQCGEQMLAPGGACNLGSLNLTQFINKTFTNFDYEKVQKYVRILVRFLDNVNDATAAPLPEYEWSIKNKRRIGVGILGWGSALYMLKTRFASVEADVIRDRLMKLIAQTAYMASIDLAVEKGMFSVCDPEKHVDGVFVNSLDLPNEYLYLLKEFGIRNSSLLSIQPTGNTGILANVSSGGCEPCFMHEYVRTVIVGYLSDEMKPFTPNWNQGEWFETEVFKFTKEGDDEILKGEFNGVVYKIDKNRGLTKEVLCQDYGVRTMKNRGEWNPEADWAITAMSMTAENHLNDLTGFARWIDSAISKTINVPNDYPLADFKNIYLNGYNTGWIKGLTTYRSGSMMSVLSAVDEKTATDEDEEIILDHVHLPKSLPAKVTSIRAENRKWYITTTFNNEGTRPQAIFVYTNNPEKGITTTDALECLIELARKKGIPECHIVSNIEKMASDNNSTKIARMISMNLRHGVLIKNLVATLDTIENVTCVSFLFQIKKYLSSFIKDGVKVDGETCPECGSHNIIFSEGCKKCSDCSWSKCG